MIERRDVLLSAGAGLLSAASSAASEPLPNWIVNGAHAQDPAPSRKEGIALALGGGAAKGFAHIPFLECLDELGVRPTQIAGTSMGAIIGAAYCSGMSGLDIRTYTLDLFARRRPLMQKLLLDTGDNWASLFNLVKPAVIDPEVLFGSILPDSLKQDFSDLEIPLKVVATDYHGQSQYVITDGALLSAIAASSALPVLLTPVRRGGVLLIDGGFVNPTPFDVLDPPDNIATIGVDVTGSDSHDDGNTPGAMKVWISSFNITLHSIVEAKLTGSHPDLLVRPPIGRFSTMDFFQVEAILAAADQARDAFKREVAAVLDRP
jgi:NTE family protein